MQKIISLVFVILFPFIFTACQKKNSDEPLTVLPKPGEPVPKSQTCENFLKKLPTDYIQGFVEVPENYSKPDGIKIKIAYYGKLISGQTPTVFFNGGPGGTSWSSYRALTNNSFQDWRSTSFIYIDQRGNGCSTAYPEFTGNASDEMIERYQHYGSTNIVRDAEVVRKKVWGAKPWKVFGQSYGAYVAHRYVVVAPEGVLSVHAHANAITSSAFERHANRIASQGRVIGDFLKRFPEDEKVLRTLGQKLSRETCVTSDDKKAKACGFELTEALIYQLGFTNSDNWLTIHQWIQYLVQNDEVNLVRLKEFADATFFGGVEATPGRDLAMMILALADRGIADRSFGFNYEGCRAIFTELKKRGYSNPEEWPINECASVYQSGGENSAQETLIYEVQYDKIFSIIKSDVLTMDSFEKALNENPQIPFFLYSGEYDTFVPKESFVEEVQRLGSRIHYTHFGGTGHEGFYVEPLVWKNLKEN